MRPIAVSKMLIQNEQGDILLVRRSKTDSRRPLQWDLPGGGVDDNEDLMHAAIRETLEETNIVLTKAQLVYAYTAPREFGSVTWTFFLSTVADNPPITLSYEHVEAQWMSPQAALQEIEYDLHKTLLTYLLDNKIIGT